LSSAVAAQGLHPKPSYRLIILLNSKHVRTQEKLKLKNRVQVQVLSRFRHYRKASSPYYTLYSKNIIDIWAMFIKNSNELPNQYRFLIKESTKTDKPRKLGLQMSIVEIDYLAE
jgi:hypothetical protein